MRGSATRWSWAEQPHKDHSETKVANHLVLYITLEAKNSN